MWWGFFWLSVSCIVLSAAVSVVSNCKGGLKKSNSFFAWAFVAAFFMFVPTHVGVADVSALDWIKAICLSVFDSIQIFSWKCKYAEIVNRMTGCPGELTRLYQTWISVMFVLAPIFTLGFVLSLLGNVSAKLKYLRSYLQDTYVFSELNDKSLVLASDIKRKNKKVAIIFTDVFEGKGEKNHELAEQARNIGAICFKKDILVIDFKKHASRKSISFFAIGEDETENLNQSLKLIENYRDRENTHIYIFSTKIESALLLTAVDKGKTKVRRINEVQSLINRVLYERGEMIFDSAIACDDGGKRISAVVVGMGNHGTEMVKALAWYGQMDGYSLQINAFDKDPLAEEKFTALAPELMAPAYNGVYVEGEAQYKITIHSSVDVETITFANAIGQITDATYVFVALGNDDANINTAVNLRMYFARLNLHPVIQAVVHNAQQKKALEGIQNYRGQDYDITFIGDVASSYTEDVIIDTELEAEALQRHLKWGKEEEFWTYEYNYRASVASAIHKKARIKCGIPGAEKKAEDLTVAERNGIEVLEHRRWNAYMRAQGYVYSGSKDKSSRNDLAKMHHNLVDFSSLTEEDKRKDSAVGTN